MNKSTLFRAKYYTEEEIKYNSDKRLIEALRLLNEVYKERYEKT